MRSIQLPRIARKIKILLDSLLRVMIMGTLHTGWNNVVHKDSSSLASNAWLLGQTGNQSVGYTTATTCTTATIIQIASFRDPEQQQTRQDTQTHLTNL